MNIVSRSQLRITIYNIISEEKQNEFPEEDYPVITKTEVMNFIESNPYFDKMLKTTINSSFSNQGEICLCGSRILIEKSIYEKFKRPQFQSRFH